VWASEQVLLDLLGYDRRTYHLANGWCLRFRFKEVAVSAKRPLGIKYSMTLHDEKGRRLYGLDNAHAIRGSIAYDHAHRFRHTEELVPYAYPGPEALLVDFFEKVQSLCYREGVEFLIVSEGIDAAETDDEAENIH
jgi:Family of unknown function (DUF6516)